MPDTPTTRRALPRPVGGDSADVPRDFRTLTNRLDEIGVDYDQGTIAARGALTPYEGLLYLVSNGGPGGEPLLTYYDGATWVDCSPQTFDPVNGDLSGPNPRPRVAGIQTDLLPIHAGGRRKAIHETRTVPASAGDTVMLGSLVHESAHLDITISERWTGTQRLNRYLIDTIPTTDTGWQKAQPVAIAGSSSTALMLEVRQQASTLSLRVRGFAAAGSGTIEALIDATGALGTWTPSSTVTAAVAPSTWFTVGAPVATQFASALPTSPVHGQLFSYQAQFPTPPSPVGIFPKADWTFRYDASAASIVDMVGTSRTNPWVFENGGVIGNNNTNVKPGAGSSTNVVPLPVPFPGLYRVTGTALADIGNGDGRILVELQSPSGGTRPIMASAVTNDVRGINLPLAPRYLNTDIAGNYTLRVYNQGGGANDFFSLFAELTPIAVRAS